MVLPRQAQCLSALFWLHLYDPCMTIEPILQPKMTQDVNRQVGFLNFPLNAPNAVSPFIFWAVGLGQKIFDLTGLRKQFKASCLQRS
jgi:hypothetical protein